MSNDEVAREVLERARYYLCVEYPAKINAATRAMPADRLWWRPNPQCNSVGNLVLHLAGNVRQWVVSGLGGAPDVRERDREFRTTDGPDREEVLQLLATAVADMEQTLQRINPAILLDARRIQGRDTTALRALLHVVEHFAGHTGQIIWIAKMFADPGAIRFYDDARGAAPLFLHAGASDV